MTIGIIVLVAATLAWLAARPTSARSTARGLQSRVRHLHRHPIHATSRDVVLMLGAELSADVTEESRRLAAAGDVPSEVLWAWAESHSAEELALALGAGYDRAELTRTASDGNEIDEESLRMHAELSGSLAAVLLAPALRPSDIRGR